ncbi:hypothetical protein [Paraburkholderia sp.]|uniref:hypothetical protein n=1 Tax=Paraburkholderia sp. TaxID=1926495 RepID=UPI0023905702|nr:hypothetical protein [Paraburkholderia sp.]MDE1182037.1 hypothetical protein [Paraburkholderia sp.]
MGAFAGWRGFEIQRKRASHPQNAMISTAPRTFTADRGEPSLSATASAPIQRDEPPASVRSLVRTPLFTVVGGLRIESKVTNGQAAAESSVTPVANEAFDATYLAALKNEGIELPLFLRNWNRAMADDLDTVDAARNAYRVAMRTALHRISGAAGLVGAHRLMDALREAGTPAVELDDRTIDALIERIQSLITQFEKAGDPLWSPSR